jgi:hypothetical protein
LPRSSWFIGSFIITPDADENALGSFSALITLTRRGRPAGSQTGDETRVQNSGSRKSRRRGQSRSEAGLSRSMRGAG